MGGTGSDDEQAENVPRKRGKAGKGLIFLRCQKCDSEKYGNQHVNYVNP
ncbi:hypothetical protein [uncultured Mobiluncus sp.]|nr:hypothetical protein [uncultured Mobiluncus sp.]